jgi:ABC-type nitrate/sulfonate/bicarbonate transport system substrate-binding protein
LIINSRKTLTVAAILAAIGTTSVSACGSDDSDADNSAGGSGSGSGQVLTIGTQQTAAAMPAFLAKRWGLLDEHGISDIKLKQFTALPALFAAVQNGQIPVAFQTVPGLVNFSNATKGTRLLLLGAGTDVTYSWVAKNDSGIPPAHGSDWQDTVRSFKGKKVGVTALGGIIDLFTQYIARKVGLKPGTDFSTAPVGAAATTVAALKRGVVDVAVGDQTTSAALGAVGTTVLDFAKGQGPPELTDPALLTGSVFVTSASTFKSDTRISGFTTALRQAKAMMSQPDRKADVIDVLVKNVGFTPEVAAAVYPKVSQNKQEVTRESYAKSVAAFRTTGILKGTAPSFDDIAADVG